jgi:hypothetical protein
VLREIDNATKAFPNAYIRMCAPWTPPARCRSWLDHFHTSFGSAERQEVNSNFATTTTLTPLPCLTAHWSLLPSSCTNGGIKRVLLSLLLLSALLPLLLMVVLSALL